MLLENSVDVTPQTCMAHHEEVFSSQPLKVVHDLERLDQVSSEPLHLRGHYFGLGRPLVTFVFQKSSDHLCHSSLHPFDVVDVLLALWPPCLHAILQKYLTVFF